jgi:two-component system sensor histidine kinase KdpD
LSNLLLYKFSKKQQYVLSIAIILIVSAISFLLSSFIGYKVVAFILLVTVSLIAMFFDIGPVLLTAFLSAIVWDYFFIPPRFTFVINGTDNVILFSMYFIIALVNGALTFKIRESEKNINKKIEKENSLKLYNTLLNSLSHELRTPISTIIGATDTLQEDKNKLSEENRIELISEISKASLRLNRQVSNLLNMSRLESGFLQPKTDWCDVNELVYDVVNQLQDNLQGKKVHINIAGNIPLVKLDYGLLEQILLNLLHNAAIYMPENGIITVHAMISKEKKLLMAVEDNGPGFPENEISHVFEKFYRLKNSKTGGTGLGLSIVKGFVESMNGSIILENRKEGGAKFTIEIPAEIAYLKDIEHD